jgi:ABC-type amino acid transport substrate-binding protein
MTSKLLLPVMLVTALAAVTASAAPEARTFPRSAAPRKAAADHVIVTAGATPQPRAFLGNAAPAQAAADQVIVINDATRYVNVTGGQTVRFVVGDRSFTWCFQNGNAHVIPFDLQTIAPQGLLNHRIVAYVADNPLYSGT